MKVKDFFRLLLKLFGLFSLVATLFSFLPSTISLALHDSDLAGLLWTIGSILIILALFLLLILKSDAIVKVLKLDGGFETDHIPFEKIDGPTILKVGTIVIGGVIFIESIPSLISNGYVLMRASVESSMDNRLIFEDPMLTKINIATNIIRMIVGFLLMTNYKAVSRLVSA